MPKPNTVDATFNQYSKQLDDLDGNLINSLANQWKNVEKAWQTQLDNLTAEIDAARKAGKVVTATQLQQMTSYQSMVAQAQYQVLLYNQVIAQQLVDGQTKAASIGLKQAHATISATLATANQPSTFALLPVDAVNAAIGMTAEGTPIIQTLAKKFPSSVLNMQNLLVNAISTGLTPSDIAKTIQSALRSNLDYALTVARTEELRMYRLGALAQMRSSGRVKKYQRVAAHNSRTCFECLALDGTIYDIDELMPLHPNDRCGMKAIVVGMEHLANPTNAGELWLKAQPEEVQKVVLGPNRFHLYQQGMSLKDMISITHDNTWGWTLGSLNLHDLELLLRSEYRTSKSGIRLGT